MNHIKHTYGGYILRGYKLVSAIHATARDCGVAPLKVAETMGVASAFLLSVHAS